jgi:peptidoglycan/xylan/chitin deacetylase (PgdA/CDA1 family)
MPAARSVVNLTVHGIGPTVREMEGNEAATWVTVDQFELALDAVVGREDVRITFDDSNASDLEIALPRLLERRLRAEFFVLAGLLGEPGRLDNKGVKELQKAGMAIGSHGWSHRDWRRVTEKEAKQEFYDAHRVLKKLTGKPITRVAIPFGSYDRHVVQRLRAAAVTRVFTSDGGRARPQSWIQARNSLREDLDQAWVADVLSPRPSPIRVARGLLARQFKRWRG